MFDVKKIRKDFPILARKIDGRPLVYLDNAATTQKPRKVIGAIENFYERHNANVARGVHTLAGEATELYEESRAQIAQFVNANPSEIIFVRNSTEALNLVAFSWGLSNLSKGDVILTSILEHHSNLLPWRMLAEKTGALVRYVDVDEDGSLLVKRKGKAKLLKSGKKQVLSAGIVLGPLESLLDNKVKLVALSAKSNMTGALQPIKEVVKLVRRTCDDAVFVLDGSHSVPHMPVDVGKLGVDFLAFSGHKMLGPMGIGVLWGRKDILRAMPPFLRGGDMISEVTIQTQEWNTVPHKFEAGTPNVAGAVGLAAAVRYLEEVGIEQIYQYEIDLADYALKKLRLLDEKGLAIEFYGPGAAKERAGVVTFNVLGVHAHDVAQILDREGIAVRSGQHCTGPLLERFGISASVRASFYLYNTKGEIDSLVKGIERVRKVFHL